MGCEMKVGRRCAPNIALVYNDLGHAISFVKVGWAE